MSNKLEFRRGYYNDPNLRSALNKLADEVFGLDFGPWNRLGYDFSEYTPFTLFDRDAAVANISASPMHLVIDGAEIDAVQIGTVATLPDYRGHGLIRQLMQEVDDYWRPQCDLTFLFAAPQAIDLYSRFGFRAYTEYRFAAELPPITPTDAPSRRLDFKNTDDCDLLRKLAENRTPVSNKLGVVRDAWLLMFHAVLSFSNQVTYLPEHNVAVLSTIQDDRLDLIDVVGPQIPPLTDILPHIADERVSRIHFGFTPDRFDIIAEIATDPDSALFVRGDLPTGQAPVRLPYTAEA